MRPAYGNPTVARHGYVDRWPNKPTREQVIGEIVDLIQLTADVVPRTIDRQQLFRFR